MSVNKKYFWLKLQKTFFDDVKVKMLRKIAGGDTYTIIYLKLMLQTVDHDGELRLEGLTEDPIQEISMLIDESEDNIRACIELLHRLKLCDTNGENILFYEVIANTGKETSSARRVREFRTRQSLLQCNTGVTKGNTELEKELDLKLEKEKDIYRDKPQTQKKKTKKVFIPPTLDEVMEYARERNSPVDPKYFFDFYEAEDWHKKGVKMSSWKGTFVTWDNNQKTNKFGGNQNQPKKVDLSDKIRLGD